MNKILITILTALIVLPTITNISITSGELEIKNRNLHLIEETIYVDDNNTEGPWDGTYEYPYQNICDGVLNAGNWDTIYIFNGLYKENLIINKPISIIGEDQNNTVIDGAYEEIIINILNDNVKIEKITITIKLTKFK